MGEDDVVEEQVEAKSVPIRLDRYYTITGVMLGMLRVAESREEIEEIITMVVNKDASQAQHTLDEEQFLDRFYQWRNQIEAEVQQMPSGPLRDQYRFFLQFVDEGTGAKSKRTDHEAFDQVALWLKTQSALAERMNRTIKG